MTDVSRLAADISVSLALIAIVVIPILWIVSMFKPRLLLAQTRISATKRAAVSMVITFVVAIIIGVFSVETKSPEVLYKELTSAVSNEDFRSSANLYHKIIESTADGKHERPDLSQITLAISELARKAITTAIAQGDTEKASAHLKLAGDTFLTAEEKAAFTLQINAQAKMKATLAQAERELANEERELANDEREVADETSADERRVKEEKRKADEVARAKKYLTWLDDKDVDNQSIYGVAKLDGDQYKIAFYANGRTDSEFQADINLMQGAPHLLATPYNAAAASESKSYCILLFDSLKLLDNATKLGIDTRFMLRVPNTEKRYQVCKIKAGQWLDALTGKTITDPGDVRHELIVPLPEVEKSGIERMSSTQRREMLKEYTIVISADTANDRDGGDLDAWVPDDDYYACLYIDQYTTIKMKYDLSFTEDEFDVIDDYHAEDVESDDQREKECFFDAVYEKGLISGRLLGSGDRRARVRIRD